MVSASSKRKGPIFKLKIWIPHHPDVVYILILHVEPNYMQGHFSTLKDPTPSQWILYFINTGGANIYTRMVIFER